MADMLNTAVSGLRAFQRALDVTGHNIANAATPGYSRQGVDLVTREPLPLGSSWLGNGVDVARVSRSFDELKVLSLRTASSDAGRLETYAANANVVASLFADAETGLGASLRGFTAAAQDVANNPTSTAARGVLLNRAQELVDRLQSYEDRLEGLDREVNARITADAAAITDAGAAIARLNAQIVSARAATGQQPNDLLDQRDRLLTDLSGRVGISVVMQEDGAANVFIGNGQALVTGSVSASVAAVADPFDPTRLTVAYVNGPTTTDISGAISGGSLGGALDFRREMLDPVRNQLGQIAIGVTDAVNAQHRQGMDLTGAMGGDLLVAGGVDVQVAAGNAGSALPAVTRTGAGALTTQDYLLEFASGSWTMRRSDTGEVVPLGGSGTAGDPFVGAGLSIVVGGTPAAGDRFRLRPTAAAVDGMRVAVTDPSRVAAAAPIRSEAGAANTGSGAVSAGQVLDASNPALRSTVTLQFTSATTYSINGAGSFTFTPGANIDVNGWRVTINGTPAAGDSFTVRDNTGGVGDNRNALALAAALSRPLLAGGTESVDGASTRLVGLVGVAAQRAQSSADAQSIIRSEAASAVDSVSGVNLDEEAANMLRFQQAYQAMAQVISATQRMFDSLLEATRR